MSEVISVLTTDRLPKSVQDKIQQFARCHYEKTKKKVDYIIQTPGRVNLIGDHIDYHGFSVLPMAIESSIWLGCSINCKREDLGDAGRGTIRMLNNDSQSYPEIKLTHSFSYGCDLDKSHKWHNYILCGYHGVLATKLLGVSPNDVLRHSKQVASDEETSSHVDAKLNKLGDMILFIDSDLAPASGLSSSSALVCASAVATCLALHKTSKCSDETIRIDCENLAEGCSKFEHLIGTHGGGMDQAVIMTAQRGYAKLVEFMPSFSCRNICLPSNVTWLISHCGSHYPKAATSGFNLRVLETKLAAALIVKRLDHQGISLDKTITLAQVRSQVLCEKTTDEIILLLKNLLLKELVMDLDEILSQLELSRSSLIEKFGASEQTLAGVSKFKLFDRCQHVFREADRVEKFKSICSSGGDIKELGRIMTESHYSLKERYECSHDDLDRLVKIAIDAGALGARLTGAGWGGCIVTLVEKSKCDYVMHELSKVSEFTFQTEPQDGCKIIIM